MPDNIDNQQGDSLRGRGGRNFVRNPLKASATKFKPRETNNNLPAVYQTEEGMYTFRQRNQKVEGDLPSIRHTVNFIGWKRERIASTLARIEVRVPIIDTLPKSLGRGNFRRIIRKSTLLRPPRSS